MVSYLNGVQTALKLIMNTMYGYTSAGLTGRMPMFEIADTITKTSKTLMITIIKKIEEAGLGCLEIIYGDTDSLFIRFKNQSREQAYIYTQRILGELNQQFPQPMKLQFEKIYQPFFISSKKRYVGQIVEPPTDCIDIKGIEPMHENNCLFLYHSYCEILKIIF